MVSSFSLLPCELSVSVKENPDRKKRHDNDSASRVIEEVIAQFQKLTIDMIGNGNIEKKQLGKKGFQLNGFGLKKIP